LKKQFPGLKNLKIYINTTFTTFKFKKYISNKMINVHEPYLSGNEWKYIKSCLDQGWVSSAGKAIDLFEKKIAKYTGSKYAVACVNGTSALHISLKLGGVKKGDEVIAPSLTFISPINAINYNNAKPVFMDNDEHYTIDIDKTVKFLKEETQTIVKKKLGVKSIVTINKKTKKIIKAIIIVHVFGNAVKIDKLVALCKKKNIFIVEDAAESVGTFYKFGKYKNKHTGTIGNIGCLSFNGNKIITTGGGGVILTDNFKIAKKSKYLITQAKDDSVFFIHNEIGYNFRLTNLQAALGIAQLESLKKYINKKKVIHQIYKTQINKISGLKISNTPNFANCNHWLNILEIKKKISKKKLFQIIKYLKKNKIEVRPIWYPNHLQKQFKSCQRYKLKNINQIYIKRLCLPSSPQLTKKQQNFICLKLKSIFTK